jgi:hypothetical protein
LSLRTARAVSEAWGRGHRAAISLVAPVFMFVNRLETRPLQVADSALTSRHWLSDHFNSQQLAQVCQLLALVAIGDDIVLAEHPLGKLVHGAVGDELDAG